VQLSAPEAAEGDENERGGSRAFAPGVGGGDAIEGFEKSVHERGIGLDGLLARGAAEMGRAQEFDIRVEMLAEQIEPEPTPAIDSPGFTPVRSSLGSSFRAAELPEKLGRHGETLSRGIDIVKHGANLWSASASGYNGRR
jgi:hypothetical protein